MFGHRSGSTESQRLIEYFRYLMAKRGYTVFRYVDDIIGIGPDAYKYIIELKKIYISQLAQVSWWNPPLDAIA